MVKVRKPELDVYVVKTLCYFDVFNYPLTIEELKNFCGYPGATLEQLSDSLSRLVNTGPVYQFGVFFGLRPDNAYIEKRLAANQEAARYMPLADQKGKLIFSFPFVRAVMVSGSLSKNCMSDDSDLDFFVVTARNRIWITRALLTIYKKLFLKNSHKWFCINYYVDEDHLRLRDQNLFTATELVTLIPVCEKGHLKLLFEANKDWVIRHCPNFDSQKLRDPATNSTLKKILEILLSAVPSTWSESVLMRLTSSFWRRKYSNLNEEEFNRSFQVSEFVAKAHPDSFQKKVLDMYQARVKEYSQKMELQLS